LAPAAAGGISSFTFFFTLFAAEADSLFTFSSCAVSALRAQISICSCPLGLRHSICSSTSCALAARCTLQRAATIDPDFFSCWPSRETSCAGLAAVAWCVSEVFCACFACDGAAFSSRIFSASTAYCASVAASAAPSSM